MYYTPLEGYLQRRLKGHFLLSKVKKVMCFLHITKLEHRRACNNEPSCSVYKDRDLHTLTVCPKEFFPMSQ